MTHSLGGRRPGQSPWVQSGELKEINLGQVSEAKLQWTNVDAVTISNASKQLLAANAGTSRTVAIKLDVNADTGIHVAFGATATTNHFLIEPGETLIVTTGQKINAIRASSATNDNTVYLLEGEVV